MQKLQRERRKIFLTVFALSLFGLLMIYEASSIYALRLTGDSGYFFKRQLVYFLLGIGFFFGTLAVDIEFLRKRSAVILGINLFLLVLALLVGKQVGGARRWLSLFGFGIQPSEFLKFSFLLYAVDYLYRKRGFIRNFSRGILPLLVIGGISAFLIVLGPDLGTVMFWLGWLFLMLFIANARKKHLLYLVLVGMLAAGALVKVYPYRMQRITSYLNPWADSQGSGFQLIQSQISYGAGGIAGVGLGESRQKFLFLPAAHTDFIFSIIAEEFGFIGVSIVLGLFFFLFSSMFELTLRIGDPFRRMLVMGIVLITGSEVIVNIGVSCGLFPTKGLSLPFVSYGGSNLIVHYILLGLLFRATKEDENIISH
ncbi:MAG: putative lipid II flippase FtsW [Candidatus Omnitrophica bacterium]|nr:putative lipid II flippase FtsW [Candidatus Omnitrophota bacterium]